MANGIFDLIQQGKEAAKNYVQLGTQSLLNKSGVQQHLDENEILREAANRGIISNELYNKMGGFNFKENVPYAGDVGTGIGATAYQVTQSVLGDQPISEIPGDVARNYMGAAAGLTKEEKDIYDNILGRREPTLTDSLVDAPSNITNKVGDLFFSPAAAAETPSSQKYSQQFSVTQSPQLEQQVGFKKSQLFDPTNIMRDSVVEDVVDTPTREFGQIRGGPESGPFGVRGISQVQDLPVDFSELDDLDADAENEEIQNLIEQAQREERRGALDTLKSFGKDVAGRTILSNILQGAGTVIGGPVVGTIAGITGLLKGGNIFEPTESQRAFNALTSQGKAAVRDIYGPGGIMQNYNPISLFGPGPVEIINRNISRIQNRRRPQNYASQKKIRDLFEARNRIAGVSMDDRTYTGFGKTGMGRDTSVQMSGKAPSKGRDRDVQMSGTTSSSTKIVCTMMNKSYGFGNFRNKIWLRQSKDLAPEYQKGYHILFLPLVKKAKTNKTIKKVLEHIAVHRTIDIRQESRGKTHILGRLYRKVLEPICYWVGKYAKR